MDYFYYICLMNKDQKSYKKEWYLKHKEERIQAEKSRRVTKTTLGICRSCSLPVFANSKLYCEKHWYAQVALNNKLKKTLVPELRALAIGQKYICPYTGDLLIPGLNMSLDHINPKSKEGTNNISNLQWINTDVNYMKRNLNEKDFLSLCHKIVKKNPNF